MTSDLTPRLQARIASSQMMQWLGLNVTKTDPLREYHLTFSEEHIGNPVLRALHGGVISCFLESCALLEAFILAPEGTQIQLTSIHISYLASAEAADMRGVITTPKFGRRIAFFEATAFQDYTDQPIARAAIGIRLIRPAEAEGTTQA